MLEGVVWPLWSEPDEESDTDETAASTADFSTYRDHDWASESVLRKLGYTARQDALTEDGRREILRQAFTGSLAESADGAGVDWGGPRSARRLLAISSFLSWLNRFQGGDKPEASEKWTAALSWLRETFYKPRMNFEWPVETPAPPLRRERRSPNAAFMKSLRPSPELAAIVGSDPLPKTEIVSKLWAYIKKHKLQDSANHRMVNSDDKLFTLFRKRQVSMFEMAGLVGKHVR